MMKAAVFSFTKRGAGLGKKVAEFLQEASYETVVWTMPKYADDIDEAVLTNAKTIALGYPCDYHELTKEAMTTCQAIVFVGATGICVRAIAPFLRDKTLDPAVMTVDERANFVIPLIAGHIGGGNELARQLSTYIGAIACVTTASDVNGRFAVDEWAVRNGLSIGSLKAAKAFAAAIVNNEAVGFEKDDFISVTGSLPKGMAIEEQCDTGLLVSIYDQHAPFMNTLQLYPKIVYLGIGCRRNTPLENIEALVLMAMENMHIDMRSVAGIASVDLKKDEQGLLAFADKYKVPASFYTAEELNSLEGDFTPSSFVKSVVGVSNVCERSAVFASGKGELLLRKTSLNGVTVAIAVKPLVLDFNKIGLRKA